ncbi:unnamed protein product [Toxocara canis]|uniref:Target of rapamycin (TOR) kinase 1 n=1 Tax=Toxocara canis TaxID=6265 RepID=A0A183UWU3_TOXCA|nr:unnamed protein product [Toxocara canis]
MKTAYGSDRVGVSRSTGTCIIKANGADPWLPKLAYGLGNCCIFDVRFNRCEDAMSDRHSVIKHEAILEGGFVLDDAVTVRHSVFTSVEPYVECGMAPCLMTLLDAAAYARFKKSHLAEKSFQSLHQRHRVNVVRISTSMFAGRYIYTLFRYSSDYQGTVNRCHDMAEFSTVIHGAMKCLFRNMASTAQKMQTLAPALNAKWRDNPKLKLK